MPPSARFEADLAVLSRFAHSLIEEQALRALSGGYSRLVHTLRASPELRRIAHSNGINAVLTSDHPDIARLKKHNKELVTSAEKNAEMLMADAVMAKYPSHAIVGEEHGYRAGIGPQWVFDPIDGTSALVRTAVAEAFEVPLPSPTPSCGVTVGLVYENLPVIGVVAELSAESGRLGIVNTWIGVRGARSTWNGQSVTVSPEEPPLWQAQIASTVPEVMFSTLEAWGGFQALVEATSGNCVTDQNCIGFMRLLDDSSGIDIVYEADLAYHDVAPLVPILQGADIFVTDDLGRPLDLSLGAISAEFRILAAKGNLHAAALQKIRVGVSPDQNTFQAGPDIHHGYAQKFPSNTQ